MTDSETIEQNESDYIFNRPDPDPNEKHKNEKLTLPNVHITVSIKIWDIAIFHRLHNNTLVSVSFKQVQVWSQIHNGTLSSSVGSRMTEITMTCGFCYRYTGEYSQNLTLLSLKTGDIAHTLIKWRLIWNKKSSYIFCNCMRVIKSEHWVIWSKNWA